MAYRLIIAGSRSFKNYKLAKEIIANMTSQKQNDLIIVSGNANGADKIGERYAEEFNIPLEVYPANWEKYGKKAGILRNHEMAKVSDGLLAFWDGKSPGTWDMITTMSSKENVKVFVVYYDDTIYQNLVKIQDESAPF